MYDTLRDKTGMNIVCNAFTLIVQKFSGEEFPLRTKYNLNPSWFVSLQSRTEKFVLSRTIVNASF